MPATANDVWNRLALLFLLLFAAALPHSIAAAQTAAGLAAATFVVGLITGRRRPARTSLDVPVAVFLLISFLAAVFSLEPATSLGKLGSTSLVLIVLVTAGLLRMGRHSALLVGVLLGSACLIAGWVVGEKIVGRGVDVVSLTPESPLARANVWARDVLLACDGHKIRSPAHFDQIIAQHDPSRPFFCSALRTGIIPYRVKILPGGFPADPSPESWGYEVKTGRWIRARGTYSHFVTFAEVMLQLTALAAGIWLAYPRKWSWAGVGFAALTLLLAGALAATYTRSSWAALALAGLAMVWMKVGWRGRLAVALAAPLSLVGLNALLIESRGFGFYNPADLSIQYRQLMWADGWRLIGEHPLLGVGMDTVLERWQELGLRGYEELGLHSHFHSTPIQLAVERGLLGLAAWLLLMGVYVVLLVRLVQRTKGAEDWWSHGLALGIFGATAGFLTSSLVQYNFGDAEVVMVFWLLAGVAVTLNRLSRTRASPIQSSS